MRAKLRPATLDDGDRLVELMGEFYAESAYPLNRGRAAAAFAALLADPQLGYVWLIRNDSQDVGYVVLTLGFSMEYGGRDAFLDDLFVRPAARGQGLGSAAIAEVRTACEALGVRALHLEVGEENIAAQMFYHRAGFAGTDRRLLTLRLAEPTHV